MSESIVLSLEFFLFAIGLIIVIILYNKNKGDNDYFNDY
jgi:hypothetical protein